MSKVAHDDNDWTMDEFAEDWGSCLRTADEQERFEAIEFALTVYRGGAAASTTLQKVLAGPWIMKLPRFLHGTGQGDGASSVSW